jgi:hypothetical protein
MIYFDMLIVSVDNYRDDYLFFESFLDTKILQNMLNTYEKEKSFWVGCTIQFKSRKSTKKNITIQKNIIYPIMDINKIEIDFKSQYLKKKPFFKVEEIVIQIHYPEPNFL